MIKLIKISNIHYIVVDDSEIKGGDWVLTKENTIHQVDYVDGYIKINNWSKITHSTQPFGFLQEDGLSTANLKLNWGSAKQLLLSEVEEVIGTYNPNNFDYFKDRLPYYGRKENETHDFYLIRKGELNGFEIGFNTHKELTKDKVFTIKDMKKAIDMSLERRYIKYSGNQTEPAYTVDQIIQFLLPETEWDIEFDEEGKIKLL